MTEQEWRQRADEGRICAARMRGERASNRGTVSRVRTRTAVRGATDRARAEARDGPTSDVSRTTGHARCDAMQLVEVE